MVAASAHSLGRNRDFRLLWIGQWHSELGSSMSAVAMPLLALALTGSTVLAGTLATISFFAMTLSAMPAGYVADRYDGRRLMVGLRRAAAVALVGVAIAVALGLASIWLLFVVGAVVSVCDMVVRPGGLAGRARDRRAGGHPGGRRRHPVPLVRGRPRRPVRQRPAVRGRSGDPVRLADAITFASRSLCTLRLRSSLRPAEPRRAPLRFFPGVAAGWPQSPRRVPAASTRCTPPS